jgi:hypothetical protein
VRFAILILILSFAILLILFVRVNHPRDSVLDGCPILETAQVFGQNTNNLVVLKSDNEVGNCVFDA